VIAKLHRLARFCYPRPTVVTMRTDIGYVPLPTPARVSQVARFDKGVTGSTLGGHGSVTGVKLDAFDD
jgi:hypothetical protein